MIGRTLGHYTVEARLGRGGMGEIYLARDTRLDRRVALKVLPETMAADPDRRARFEREARAVAALSHPNIVTIHSVEEAEGLHFLTMELVDGHTLGEVIPDRGFDLEGFLRVAIPLVDAVAAAHAQGIVHRDLKPDNVMVSTSGLVKVLDFGLAKQAAPEGVAPLAVMQTVTRTGEGIIVGTVSYMSPEQAEGKPVDARSDVFALGIVLYEMASGHRPFPGDSAVSVLSSILKDTPPSLGDLRPELPRSLAALVHRCLDKDPARRFQSAAEVRAELERLRQTAGRWGVRSWRGPPLGGDRGAWPEAPRCSPPWWCWPWCGRGAAGRPPSPCCRSRT
ncbi:MAG: serine/threonine-protein kinase [Thermoanaerobaculaceae bacterium]